MTKDGTDLALTLTGAPRTVPVSLHGVRQLLTTVWAVHAARSNFDISLYNYVEDGDWAFITLFHPPQLDETDLTPFLGSPELEEWECVRFSPTAIALRVRRDALLSSFGQSFIALFLARMDGQFVGASGDVWQVSGGAMRYLNCDREPHTPEHMGEARAELIAWMTDPNF